VASSRSTGGWCCGGDRGGRPVRDAVRDRGGGIHCDAGGGGAVSSESMLRYRSSLLGAGPCVGTSNQDVTLRSSPPLGRLWGVGFL
jgi:hypothetical protein